MIAVGIDEKEKPPRPGDPCPCPKCDGRLKVYKTRISFARASRVRYLHCPVCGHLPDKNKWVIPLEYAPARNKPDYHG